jgi:hypothetical protein
VIVAATGGLDSDMNPSMRSMGGAPSRCASTRASFGKPPVVMSRPSLNDDHHPENYLLPDEDDEP